MLLYFCRTTVLIVCSLVTFGFVWLLVTPGFEEYEILLCIWAVAFSGLSAIGGFSLLAVTFPDPPVIVDRSSFKPIPPRSGSAVSKPKSDSN